jgi:tetratricopeptide (TPR) repeat protein/predicted aspartyl protease
MIKRSLLAAMAALSLSAVGARTSAGCTLNKNADLPVTLARLRATIPAKINGVDAVFAVDSGAFYSTMSAAAAAEYRLPRRAAPYRLAMVSGLGGEADTLVATVKQFTLAGTAFTNYDFLVGGSEAGPDVAGFLGQNILGRADVEYDLANGAIRLFHPNGCGSAMLAYWDKSQPYSVLDIGETTPMAPFTTATAVVNGVTMRVLFDTGSPVSFLTLGAARRAGIDPHGAGATASGAASGVGRRVVATWIAPVGSFKIGDEEIHNTRLRIADTPLMDHDMLIGMDFFLSHRVYVAKSQQKLYFTYNGGPVFNLTSAPSVQATADSAAKPGADSAAKPGDGEGAPTDAAGFARRGAAYAARRDYERAIADLTRARELAPGEPSYLYQRALAYTGSNQPLLAMADLDQSLKLEPDDIPALMARARLRIAGRDKLHALADLDAADKIAPRQADARLDLGSLYVSADSLAPAIAQFDLWIAAHPSDGQQVRALGARCWARALADRDLDKALADCNAAHALEPKNAAILDSRGLVRLRLGDFDRSIADYDAALSLNPKIAWSLYGRGLAKLRKGASAAGAADIAAAAALQPRLPNDAKAHGVGP